MQFKISDTMKAITLSLLIVFTLLTPLVSCIPQYDYLWEFQGLDLYNDSEISLKIYGEMSKDTSLSHEIPSFSIFSSDLMVDENTENEWISAMAPTDTLRLFYFHSDSIAQLGWNKIRDEYKVLVRYDLSQEDIYNLNAEIHYPPTDAMKGIHMYPPYEEVLENYWQMTGRN